MKVPISTLVLSILLLFHPIGLIFVSSTDLNREMHTQSVSRYKNSFSNKLQAKKGSSDQKYTTHEPISIFSDDFFLSLGFPRSGSIEDPYRIEGFHIFMSGGGDTIAIRDTTVFFVIRDNYLEGEGANSWAISLTDVRHGIIENNIAVLHDFCIVLYSSHNITFLRNTLSNNGAGIHMEDSDDNFISNNLINNSRAYAVYFDKNSDKNIVINNRFIENNWLWAQAGDDGQNNIFKNNYWSDWVSPDTNFDGIVDNAYFINGDARNLDQSPLTTWGSYVLRIFNINLNVLAGTILLVVITATLVISVKRHKKISKSK